MLTLTSIFDIDQNGGIQLDNRFSANPLVTGEAGIRFYAGIPLCTPSVQNIGKLCVIDTKPRDLSGVEMDMIRDLAGLVVDKLELRQIATTDSLTGLRTKLLRGNRYKHAG